jgi:hypothetical protein
MTEYFETSSKIPQGRGMAANSIALIKTMYELAKPAQPITGRGIGYKLFGLGLIESVERGPMQQVYRLLTIARKRGMIPWEWIAEEGRQLEGRTGWENPKAFVETVRDAYRRDFWQQQPTRVQIWSEKGTVSGLLRPVMREYGVQFRNVRGFTSTTRIYETAEDNDKDLVILYVGDYDPSGMNMSEHDIPYRLEEHDADHVVIKRIALIKDDTRRMPSLSFPASDKGPKKGNKGDPRYRWFVQNYGDRCWELDAMDPNDLRERVKGEIESLIEWAAWERCDRVNRAEQESLRHVLDQWGKGKKKR